MQKKILWGVAALVLLFVFAGCSQPTDYTFKAGKLDNPTITVNKAYEGLNLITWNPVINASSYEVYRYDQVDRVTVKLSQNTNGNSPTNIYYLDFVGWENQLRNGRKYDYTVVAISGTSTSEGAGAGALPVQNGSSKTTITAIIPPREQFSAELNARLEGDKVLIDNKPNLKYTVAQVYGNNTISRTLAGAGSDVSNSNIEGIGQVFDEYRTAKILSGMGGKYSIIISAVYGGYADYFINTSVEPKYFDFDEAAALSLTSFGASWKGDAENVVNLRWKSNGDTFNIYRAELDQTRTTPSANAGWVPGGGGVITIKSDWVDAGNSAPAVNDDSSKPNYGFWEATASVPKISEYYIFAIIAKNADGASELAFSSLDTEDITLPNNLVARFKLKDDAVDNQDVDNTKALITWTVDGDGTPPSATKPGTYKLERFADGAFDKDVTPSSNDYYTADYAVVDDGPLAAGHEYKYKLTIIKGGIEKSKESNVLAILGWKADAFRLATSSDDGGEVTANKSPKSISFTIESNQIAATGAHEVKVLYRITGKILANGQIIGGESYSTYYKPVPSVPQVAAGTKDVPFNFVLPAGEDSYENVYSLIAYVDGEQVDQEITGVRLLGTAFTAAYEAKNATNAPVGSLPAFTVQIGSGSHRTASATTGTPQITKLYTGPNANGLTAKVTYTAVDTTTQTVNVTVKQVIGTASAPSNGSTTTPYVYYLEGIPSKAAPDTTDFDFATGGQLSIVFPWSNTPQVITVP